MIVTLCRLPGLTMNNTAILKGKGIKRSLFSNCYAFFILSTVDKEVFIWSDEAHRIQDLFFGSEDLPMIVRINGGYCGNSNWETISSGDVSNQTSSKKKNMLQNLNSRCCIFTKEGFRKEPS